MISTVLACGAIVLSSLDGDGPSTDPSERNAYKSAAAAAGHDAAAHVRLALWCEAHGLTAERLEHLTQAVRYQPTNALARGLLGLIRHQGQWETPEDVGAKVRDDPAHRALIQEYLERRAATPHIPQDQMKLAAWCEGKRLKEQAQAHYNAAIRLDPTRADAWKHLGYKKQGYRWVKPEELAAEKQEAIRQKQADRRWRSKLEKLRDDLQSKDAARRARGEQGLAQVTDPRAAPAIWAVFVTGSARHQMAAIQMFGQIDGPSASNALAALAVLSPLPEVRGRAIETLMRRDPRDVVGRLIGMVHKPMNYQVRPVRGPGSPGELFVEGERFNLQRFYENRTTGLLLSIGVGRLFTPDVPFDPFSIQNMAMAMGAWNTPLTLTSKGFAPSPTDPIAPQAAAQAARALAANLQNAPAILNQLITNPNNRIVFLPPGYTFQTDSSYSVPVTLVPVPGHINGGPNGITGPPTGATLAGMGAFAKQVQAQKNNPLSPMGLAIQAGKIQAHSAQSPDNAIIGEMLAAQQMAAQRDIQLGQEIQLMRQANQLLEQRLEMDVRFIEWTNEGIMQANAHVLPVLKAITGVDLGAEPDKWRTWWMDQLGYTDRAGGPGRKPTYQENVTYSAGRSDVTTVPLGEAETTVKDDATVPAATLTVRACFAAGTLVRTIEGARPIESIEVGDKILCQDIATGALEFQPVLATRRDQPAPTVRIRASGEAIAATGLHRFWKAGKGWTMARELKVGDRLRILGGILEIESIEAGPTQPTYNVEVADNGDLFVGTKGLLVHDFSFVPAVPEPFDRQPELAAPTASTRP